MDAAMKTGTKGRKKIVKWLGITLGVIVAIFVMARYGWRLFGYNMCDSIHANWTEEVTFDDDKITVLGGTTDSFSSFVGYKYTIKDGNLYLGIKHNMMLGFIQRLGSFHIEIPINGSNIENVYYKDGKEERLVWNVDKGRNIE